MELVFNFIKGKGKLNEINREGMKKFQLSCRAESCGNKVGKWKSFLTISTINSVIQTVSRHNDLLKSTAIFFTTPVPPHFSPYVTPFSGTVNIIPSSALQLMKVTVLAESSRFPTFFTPVSAPWQTLTLYRVGATPFFP